MSRRDVGLATVHPFDIFRCQPKDLLFHAASSKSRSFTAFRMTHHFQVAPLLRDDRYFQDDPAINVRGASLNHAQFRPRQDWRSRRARRSVASAATVCSFAVSGAETSGSARASCECSNNPVTVSRSSW